MRAIVLAGGRGERLRPYTDDRPKPMLELKGYPILAYQLYWLREYDVDEVVISCGYLHHIIKAYFGDGSAYDLSIKYAVEAAALGRGGGIKNSFGHLDPARANDPVIVTNGDVITDLDLRAMVEAHQERRVIASLYLTPLRSPYGIADLDPAGYVLEFREKPELPYWINGGVYVFSPGICPYLPERGDIEDTTFPRLSENRQLVGHLSHAYWRAVDTIKDLTELSRELDARPMGALGPA